jgi:RNA polymerase sigma-70 factor, ECF subfamily
MNEAARDMNVDSTISHTGIFERHRTRLFGIAYRMLGSVDDAEDVLQETYLRWHQAEASAVRNPEAWLVAVTTRLAIDRLRRATTERELYAGNWLPEPIATAPQPADRRAEMVSDLSMAFLVLLERLGLEERAAFLLRDVFNTDYEEIARVLDKSEAACRQLVHRARERVRGTRARFTVPLETKERLLENLLAALEADDRDTLLGLVAEDATWTSDGGGKVAATRRVVVGGDRVVRLMLGVERKWHAAVRHRVAWVNGEPTIVTHTGNVLRCTTSIETDGERLTAFYRVLNPEKLRHAEVV